MRKGRRGPDPEIPGLKTRNPEVPNLNKLKSQIPKFEKKEFPDPERVNPAIPSLKTLDPGVPLKVLFPLLLATSKNEKENPYHSSIYFTLKELSPLQWLI